MQFPKYSTILYTSTVLQKLVYAGSSTCCLLHTWSVPMECPIIFKRFQEKNYQNWLTTNGSHPTIVWANSPTVWMYSLSKFRWNLLKTSF